METKETMSSLWKRREEEIITLNPVSKIKSFLVFWTLDFIQKHKLMGMWPLFRCLWLQLPSKASRVWVHGVQAAIWGHTRIQGPCYCWARPHLRSLHCCPGSLWQWGPRCCWWPWLGPWSRCSWDLCWCFLLVLPQGLKRNHMLNYVFK